MRRPSLRLETCCRGRLFDAERLGAKVSEKRLQHAFVAGLMRRLVLDEVEHLAVLEAVCATRSTDPMGVK